MRYAPRIASLACVLLAPVPRLAMAAPEALPDVIARFQATYIGQQKDAFDAAYTGPNSLTPERESSYSFTATAFLGARLWQGAELYLNPEVSQGRPLSNLTGLGGFTNGEMARTSGTTLKLYRARVYLRQTWGMGGGSETVEADANQLPGRLDRRRITVTVGNLSLLDIFDPNRYAHDARTQFQNWALVTYGAYDFAADSRGYTWAAVVELARDEWVFRAGRALLPAEPNGLALDSRIARHFGEQLEIEHAYEPERILEAYYDLSAFDHLWLTADLQHVRSPAYNGDRGPVTVIGLRVHTEF